MLKRIKETLTCNSSGRKRESRTINRLKSHHLLHSDKSTYTYFYKNKVRSLLYSNKVSTIPLVLSAFGLLLVLGMMVSPSTSTRERMFGGDKAYAEEGASNEPVPYTVPPDDGVSLTINTPLPDDEVIEKQVSGSGAKYITVDFTVGAHNVDDYKVYVQADSATLTGKSYSDTITTINAPTTATEMNSATKKWGYAVAEGQNVSADSMTFNAIQTSVSIPAASVAGENGAKILNHTQPYTLAFAANLDGAKADHYKSNITLSVAANAEEVTNIGFAGVTYMQEMTSGVCNSTNYGDVGRLIDSRDNKIYWVSKLRDDSCWMTQNLDLDLNGRILTPEDSDVVSNWDGNNAVAGLWKGDSTTYNMINYYDPGMFVYINPTVSAACDAATGLGTDDCRNKGWVNVVNMIPSEDPFYGTDVRQNMYNAHYLVGNYYSWNAATAGTGEKQSVEWVNAIGSICPLGWKLPHGDKINDKVKGSYAYLFGAYGLSNSISLAGIDIRKSPFYFMYAGDVDSSIGLLSNVGRAGFYWTGSPSNLAQDSYYLFFDGSQLNSSYGGHGSQYGRRHFGMSVRCVAR